MNNPGDNDSIEVKRRRQGASGGPSGRADAPQRRKTDGASRPPSGGGGGGSGMSPFGGGSGSGGGSPIKLPVWAIVLLIIGYFVYQTFFSGGQGSQSPDTSSPALDHPTEASGIVNEPSSTPEPVFIPTDTKAAPGSTAAAPGLGSSGGSGSTTGKGGTWTVMLYQDADDQILEQDIMMDLNEVERVGSTERVNIVTQIDRFKGAYSGDGNWTDTRRYYIKKDNDLNRLKSQQVGNMGEKDMGSGSTLADFMTWAVKTYPADHYVLVLSDHGMGWPGGWSDGDPKTQDSGRAPIVSALEDDNLYLNELDSTLKTVQSQTGVQKLDMIGLDACLMSHLEVYSALAPYARYAVASQETEPALGWAYTGFLSKLVQNPDMDAAELSRQVVQSYIRDDQRIQDDQARSDFLRQGSPMGGLFGGPSQISASQLASQLGRDVTLTAVDLSKIPALMQSVNDLALALQDEDETSTARARDYAQSYTNIFGKDSHAPYIDLGSFLQMLKKQGVGSQTSQQADRVLAAEKDSIIAERHGAGKPGATGVSIYFPNSTLYRSPIAGPQSYTGVAQRFAQDSLWDDFLANFYNNIPINPNSRSAVVPSGGGQTRSPGSGQIQISPVTVTGGSASPGKPVTLSAQVSGKNIGYIYLFVGYYDQSANSIFVIDYDYLESSDTREVGGVFYPVWPQDKPFTIKLSWDPTVFEVSDGRESEATAFTPQNYGASAENAVYSVDGTYTYVNDGQKRHARAYFRNGKMEKVYGFDSPADASGEVTGAPREIIPQAGDTFTIQEKWLDLNSSGQVQQTAAQDGKTLTFGGQPFTWQEVYAAAGEYVVGFIVQDLDGNTRESYQRVTVR